MKRRAKIIYICMIMLMLLIPLLFTSRMEGAVSDVDGRTLLSRPVFGTEGYTAAREAWLRDRLGFRDSIINSYQVLNDKLLGELINPSYQYGREKHAFTKIHSNIEYTIYHQKFVQMVAMLQEYCESRGTEFYYVLPPEKESIYKEYLPYGVHYDDSWVGKMLNDMGRLGINYIDLRGALAELKGKDDPFNRLYDVGHWNQAGAFYGMRELTVRMREDLPDMKPLKKDEYWISSEKIEKLPSSNQAFHELVPKYTLKAGYSDITGDLGTELHRNETFPAFQLVWNYTSEASVMKRLLLFQDEINPPFAYARSRETASVCCFQNVIDLAYYYNVFKPDVVILENMEYVVNDYYFSEAAMDAAVYNPAILKNYPEGSFLTRKRHLLANTKSTDFEGLVYLTPGYSIDKVRVAGLPTTARYVYLITDSKVIDLRLDEDGYYSADVRRGDIVDNQDLELYIIGQKNQRRYAHIRASYAGPVPVHELVETEE